MKRGEEASSALTFLGWSPKKHYIKQTGHPGCSLARKWSKSIPTLWRLYMVCLVMFYCWFFIEVRQGMGDPEEDSYRAVKGQLGFQWNRSLVFFCGVLCETGMVLNHVVAFLFQLSCEPPLGNFQIYSLESRDRVLWPEHMFSMGKWFIGGMVDSKHLLERLSQPLLLVKTDMDQGTITRIFITSQMNLWHVYSVSKNVWVHQVKRISRLHFQGQQLPASSA